MFFTRLISSIILVVVAAATVYAGGPVLAAVLYLISCIAFMELMKACGIHTENKSFNALEIVGLLGITVYYGMTYWGSISAENASVFFAERYVMSTIIFTLILFMFVYVFSYPKYYANQVMAAFFSLFYAPVMLSFIFLTRQLNYGIYIVWMIFISSWVCDTCAYLVGMPLGRHKLTSKLSPKKSVEGAVGGVAGSALVGGLFGWLVVERVIDGQTVTWVFALIGGIGAVISQIGDLAASAVKRNHDIKDYGKLIPGHGGIMDRFDSVIFTAPIIYFLALMLIK